VTDGRKQAFDLAAALAGTQTQMGHHDPQTVPTEAHAGLQCAPWFSLRDRQVVGEHFVHGKHGQQGIAVLPAFRSASSIADAMAAKVGPAS
jgi:hypothetical protein